MDKLDPPPHCASTISGPLILFRFSTTLKLKSDVNRIRVMIRRRIKHYMESKTIMVMMREVQKKKRNEKDNTICQVICFGEEKLDVVDTFFINQAAGHFKKMFLEWLVTDADSHPFTVEYTNPKNKVLVDWRNLKPAIASASVWLQKGPTCWAHAIAVWLEKNFIIFKEEGEEEVRVSPMDLIDWVYSMEELYLDNPQKEQDKSIDSLGTYGCKVKRGVKYAVENGVALLANYEVKIEERKLEVTRKDLVAFEAMRRARGPRVFPQNVHYELNLNLEVIVKNLNFGVLVGTMKTCKGCQYCRKGRRFFDYNGKGVYTMPKHPSHKEKDFGRHTVVIDGAGNLGGLDYVHVINSHGTKWGNNGEGNVDIRLFTIVARLGGIEKKSWNGEEWI